MTEVNEFNRETSKSSAAITAASVDRSRAHRSCCYTRPAHEAAKNGCTH